MCVEFNYWLSSGDAKVSFWWWVYRVSEGACETVEPLPPHQHLSQDEILIVLKPHLGRLKQTSVQDILPLGTTGIPENLAYIDIFWKWEVFFYDDSISWEWFPKDAKISFYDHLDTAHVIYRKRLAKSLK